MEGELKQGDETRPSHAEERRVQAAGYSRENIDMLSAADNVSEMQD